MESQVGRPEISAAQAALQLGLSRERVIRLVQTGKLAGRRDPALGWRVSRDAVDAIRPPVAA